MHLAKKWKNKKKQLFGIYRTNACAACPMKTKCTTSKSGRQIYRWEHQELVDEHRKKMLLHGSEKMRKRKALVEHPFGTIKRALNSGYTLLKGKKKVNGEFGLIALAYNMNLASWNPGAGIPLFPGIPCFGSEMKASIPLSWSVFMFSPVLIIFLFARFHVSEVAVVTP